MMSPEEQAAKHEGRFRLDILNVALAALSKEDGMLQEATEILLADILSFGRDIHRAAKAAPHQREAKP